MNSKWRKASAAALILLLLGVGYLAWHGQDVPPPAPPKTDPTLDTTPVQPNLPEEVPSNETAATPVDSPDGLPEAGNRTQSVVLLVTTLDGSPVPDAWVEVLCYRAEGDGFEATDEVEGETGSDGTLQVEIPEGSDRLRLDVAPPDESVLLPVRIEPWDRAKSTIVLREALRVTGRVVDPADTPVPGVQVFLIKDDSGKETHTHSDVDGKFEFSGLPPGEVKLEVRFGARTAGVDRFARAGDRDLRLVVKAGGVAVVRVEGFVYPSDPGVVVFFDEQAGQFLRSWAKPDREGRLFLPGLDPKRTYTLWMGPFMEGGHLYRTGLRPGTETTVAVSKGAELTGRVAWPESRPPYHLQIFIKSKGIWTTTQVGFGGIFTFPSLPPGAWKVEVTGSANEGKLTGSEVIRTGEPGVVHIR